MIWMNSFRKVCNEGADKRRKDRKGLDVKRQKMHIVILGVLLLVSLDLGTLWAYPVWSEPEFATENDSIVIYYDAGQGTQGLMNYSGDVYAHTGVITNLSARPSNWRYVVTPWPGAGNANRAKNRLEKVGDNLYKLVIGYPREYYVDHNSGATIPPGEKILQLAFVFRNADGSLEGKDAQGGDIFLDLFESGLTVVVEQPEVNLSFGDPKRSPIFSSSEDTVHIIGKAAAIGTTIRSLELFLDTDLIAESSDSVLSYDFIAADFGVGYQNFRLIAEDERSTRDTADFVIMVNPPVEEAPLPPSIRAGINFDSDQSVTLALLAPHKDFVYVIGDFNDWKVEPQYYMKRYTVDQNNVYYWLEIDGLTSGEEYAFQYLIDGDIRVADAYTEKILDPYNDPFIDSDTYPDLKNYPTDKTERIVSTFSIDEPEYEWQSTGFRRVPKEELVIYEMLLRDFVRAHDFQTLADTLDYLERLGINAIELMPVSEFEGNLSWGYNPSFYFAVDKYYGSADAFKAMIDEAHRRGIAVIMDLVLNHAYGQNPWVRMYADNLDASPWFNASAPHTDYSWGYDFDHEKEATQAFVDRLLEYWVTEFRIDGFRLDFTRGFTNRRGGSGPYDASRIALLKRMYDEIMSVDPTVYIILEHLVDSNDEMETLADYGMLLWGNLNHHYGEAAMGWHKTGSSYGQSDFSWGYYGKRGWSRPHLVTYMESHDEERLMFKNLSFGNSNSDYSIKEMNTALNRMKLVGAFFFTIPGPKMIWQFAEVGYDYSINYNGRLGEKPIRWDYPHHTNRAALYRIYQSLLQLRRENEIFRSPETGVVMHAEREGKSMVLTHRSMNAVILGNFDVVRRTVSEKFPHRGRWYSFFREDSIDIETTDFSLSLAPGEFVIYTDRRLETPTGETLTAIDADPAELAHAFGLQPSYPNPFNLSTSIPYEIDTAAEVTLRILDLRGYEVYRRTLGIQQPGYYQQRWDGITKNDRVARSGIYFVILEQGDQRDIRKITLLK